MTKKTVLKVKGIHCQSCVSLIKSSLKDLPGIISVAVDVDSQKAEVIYDGAKTNESDIIEKIKKAGDYRVEEWDGANKNKAQEVSSSKVLGDRVGQKTSSSKNFLTIVFVISISLNLIFLGNGASRSALKDSLANLSQSSNAVQNNQEQAPSENIDAPAPAEEPQQAQIEFSITKDDHIRGNFDAPITLVEFSDFECPFCERHYRTLKQLLNEYPQTIRLVYKHFPLGFHQNAQKAAEASECASEQGKFWEYHDKLFENYQDYSLDNFQKWAKDLSLNSGKFNDCLNSGKYAQKVKNDAQEGAKKGVNGTPATFVNGQLVSGAVPYDSFKQVIDSLLQ